MVKTQNILQFSLKKNLLDIRPGDTVAIHQKIREGNQERIQVFEGLVLARRHGKEAGATITVRKVASGVGVEKIFPVHSPIIEKIEILKRGKVRRAKLYYLRTAKGKKARLKKKEFAEVITGEEKTKETPPEKAGGKPEPEKERKEETKPEEVKENEAKTEEKPEEAKKNEKKKD